MVSPSLSLGAETRAKAISASDSIDGWLTAGEAAALFDMARDATGPIVEIGSWQGRSTAALALGSRAGTKQPVYAIDNFIGPQRDDRPSAHGGDQCGEQLLRANLNRVGINGEVTILAKPASEAADEIPPCGLLFVDGCHLYEAVADDLRRYLPKVLPGGVVMMHDCVAGDPGVVRAMDEFVTSQPDKWVLRGRVDSAIIAVRRPPNPLRHQVALAFPGGMFSYGSCIGVINATLGSHDLRVLPESSNGFDDFNVLWAAALNLVESRQATHFAMLHSDITPDPGWLDILLHELDIHQADLVSAIAPIKDDRGVTSCGIGDQTDPWNPWRRFTMRELVGMPETFSVADTPHPDRYLLHNTGCFVCDLRNPLFFRTDEHGDLRAFFNFPLRVRRGTDGFWTNGRESEDWYFSRQLHALGAKTLATRKVRLSHRGGREYPNWAGWGSYRNGDEDTRHKWSPEVSDGTA